ncbi:MAG: ABC transporter ATP-binding protein/permease [Lachnospiraceae bacterium]|nr:ABC transporter ATP-binding protein/permease [Lachnospiraceae bacterium]
MPSGTIHEDTDSNRSGVMKRVLRLEIRYIPLILISFLFAIASVAFSLLVPIRIGNAIDLITAGTIGEGFYTVLLKTVICALLAGFSQYGMNLVNNHVVFHTVQNVRNNAFARLQRFPVSYLDVHPEGDLVSRLCADTEQFADGLLLGFTQLFTGVITIVGTLFFMFSMNVTIALIVVVLTPVSLFVAKFIAGHTFDMFKLQSSERGEQTALINEVLTNVKTVKAYGREEKVLARFDEINARLAGSSQRALFFSSLTNPSTRFVNNLIYAGVACVGAIAVYAKTNFLFGGLSVGVLTAFLSYATQYMKPFNEITSVVTELQNAIACAARVFEVIDDDHFETETDQSETMPKPQGNIRMRDVDFSYIKEQELIKGLNVDVKSGMKVAIVGPTGCGKTTLINLLMRFYEVDAGTILIDEKDCSVYRLNDVRSAYGMVLQDTWLFSGTVRENILFGKPDATEEEMIRAAKDSHAHAFIRRLPDGYDTKIGEDGGILSQGQKQLLCITRLMLNKPPMLILDEATSSIDTRTEMKIQSAFRKLMEGRTAFIVAHRLSTIRDADLILVMKDGMIIEQGTHESLMLQNGFYAELYRSA